MQNDLDAAIDKIITDAAAGMARDIAHSVRRSLTTIIMGNGATPTPATQKPMRRPPSALPKVKPTAAVSAVPADAMPAKAKPVNRKASKRGGVTEADVTTVLDSIGANPGLRPGDIFKKLGGEPALIKKALARLRDTGRVTVKGIKRGATYTAAGASAAPPAPPPARTKGKPAKVARGKAGKKPRADRSYTDADVTRVLALVSAKPGLRPSEYQAESKVSAKAWGNLIAKLKETKRIKVVGAGPRTTYVVA